MSELNEQLDQLQSSIEQRFNADMRDPEVIALSKRLDNCAAWLNGEPFEFGLVEEETLAQWAKDIRSVIIVAPIAEDAPPAS